MTTVHAQLGHTPYITTLTGSTSTVIADEPVELGGGGTGQNPFELLLSSLGACTAITLRMYAQRKNWDIGEVSVHLSLVREMGKATIQRDISYSAPLEDAQRERLRQIADACPVHKLLSGEIIIQTS